VKTYILKPKSDSNNGTGFYAVVAIPDNRLENVKLKYDLEEIFIEKDLKAEKAFKKGK
jgi:hypothetical protein